MTKKEITPPDKEVTNDSLNEFEKDLSGIGDDISGMFEGLGDSLEAVFDKEDKARGIAGGLFKLCSSATKLAWGVGSLAVKNTPKVIVAVAEVRREVTETIVDTYEEIQKEEKEKEFDDKFTKKIEQIKLKQKSDAETRPKLSTTKDELDE